jgi:hypothetical protein
MNVQTNEVMLNVFAKYMHSIKVHLPSLGILEYPVAPARFYSKMDNVAIKLDSY